MNRCSYSGDGIDAYNCGRCQENIEWYVLGDSAYDKCESDEDVDAIDQSRQQNEADWHDKHCDEEAYDRYLEERIKEVDKQDPDAKTFRLACELLRS